MEREAETDGDPGPCPRCEHLLEWLAVDPSRRGRICRSCGWVDLPEVPVVRHTVGSLMRRILPDSRLTEVVEYLDLWVRRRIYRGGTR